MRVREVRVREGRGGERGKKGEGSEMGMEGRGEGR